MTVRNLTDQEFEFICNQENQRRWAILSIKKRCTLFHRTFNDRYIKKGVMVKIMKMAGLKKKKIEVCNVPAKKEDRVGEFNQDTLRLDNKLHEVSQEKSHLVFLDECLYKARDF